MTLRSLRIVRTFLSVYYAYMVEYRAELIFWVLSGSFPLIFLGLWNQAAQSNDLGFTPAQFAQYFLAVFLARQFTVVWVIWDFEKEVVQGTLSPLLLQPIDPVWRHFFGHVAERFTRLPFVLLLVGLFCLLYPEAIWIPTPYACFWGIVSLILAFCLRFLIQYTFAMLAFWVERANAIEQFWFLFYTFLSGLVAPLTLFPDAVREFALWTPFPYLIYFPASLLVGLPVDLPRGLITMASWGLLAFIINRKLWRLGLKHYSGMGA
ncbi:MAG: ABC-2 type transport system permease protein [Phormidesmis priestleyi Ana]|uniref:ABC-2 type transport system permease protein n=1 Tax=Phormidesmis priestleyi Ana TaxID=1666911 RepID=A0A0P7Z3Y9_9CYAN|nr:MAG: ABC-2 type transport system permease protein [Phormidesmis priestleyi Ana]